MSALWLEGPAVVRKSNSLVEIDDDAFVLTALGIPHRVDRLSQLNPNQTIFQLQVDPVYLSAAEIELSRYHHENISWPVREPVGPKFKFPIVPLVGFILVLTGFYWIQNFLMNDHQVIAAASSHRIFTHAEVFRAITSLFLHADFSHFFGNLFLAAVLAAALIHLVGSGLAFSGFLISGAIGNIINSYFYDEPFRYAYGFSTAVFGAAGVWAGFRLIEVTRAEGLRNWRRTIAPIGAALVFLAAWGSSPQTDFMAHFWGALVGFVFGMTVAKLQLEQRLGWLGQSALSFAVVLAIVIAWKSVL